MAPRCQAPRVWPKPWANNNVSGVCSDDVVGKAVAANARPPAPTSAFDCAGSCRIGEVLWEVNTIRASMDLAIQSSQSVRQQSLDTLARSLAGRRRGLRQGGKNI